MDRRKIAFLSRSLYFRIDRDQRSRRPGDTLPFSFLADRNLGSRIDNEHANDHAGDQHSRRKGISPRSFPAKAHCYLSEHRPLA